jgi:hypothetical protein
MFLPISDLKRICGYEDRRSILKWVHSLGVRSHKVGKNWCVVGAEMEQALALHYVDKNEKPKSKNEYIPKNEAEQKFLCELEDLLSKKQEV